MKKEIFIDNKGCLPGTVGFIAKHLTGIETGKSKDKSPLIIAVFDYNGKTYHQTLAFYTLFNGSRDGEWVTIAEAPYDFDMLFHFTASAFSKLNMITDIAIDYIDKTEEEEAQNIEFIVTPKKKEKN